MWIDGCGYVGCGSAKVGVGMVGVYQPRWVWVWWVYIGQGGSGYGGSAKVGVGMVGVDWPRWVWALLGHMCFTYVSISCNWLIL